MSWLIWQSPKRTIFWLIGLRRIEKRQLDPRVLSHRGIVWCKILQLHLLRKPLNLGAGSSGLHSSSRVVLYPLLSSRLAQGQMFSSQSVPTMQIAALSVGALLTLLEHARKQDSLINGKDSVDVGSKNGQLSNYSIASVLCV